MLGTGVSVDQACARIRILVGADDADSGHRHTTDDSGDFGGPDPRPVEPQGDIGRDAACRGHPLTADYGSKEHDRSSLGCTTNAIPLPRAERGVHKELLDRVMRLNEQHWTTHGRSASAEKIRQHLGIGSGKARQLARLIREQDRAAVCNNPEPHPSPVPTYTAKTVNNFAARYRRWR
jgi:hypothetical protein